MNIAIRVDSSNKIGTGHIYRTLSLAEKLKEKKIKVIFICQKLPGNIVNLIKKKNFKVKIINNLFSQSEKKILNNHFKSWSYKMQVNDTKKTNLILNKNKCDWMIVDHYGLSEIWEKRVTKQSKVAVIDDLFNKKHFCDLYINYHNKLAKKYKTNLLTNRECKILDGLKYVMINNKYVNKKSNFIKKNKNIFIYMGGVDRKKMAIKIVNKVKNHFNTTILLGKNSKYLKEIMMICKKNKFIKIIKKNFSSLKYFFENYGLVISSGGLSMYEQICCGANSLVIPQNKYQKKICNMLFKKGYINYFDTANRININILRKLIKLNKKKGNIIDGFGNDRILKKIISIT